MQFIDAYAFDVRSVKKTCVHIVHPDRRLIPFDTYNLFYRDGLEQSRLAPLSGPTGRIERVGSNLHGREPHQIGPITPSRDGRRSLGADAAGR